jgi:nitrite reductase/ring-hydroxylating ferredoxin subunit
MDGDGWATTVAFEELRDGRGTKVMLGEDAVLVVRSGERVFAIGNRCTHQGAPLDRGPVKIGGSEATVTCPAHGSVFRLADGGVIRGPATAAVLAYEARVADGTVELRPRA